MDQNSSFKGTADVYRSSQSLQAENEQNHQPADVWWYVMWKHRESITEDNHSHFIICDNGKATFIPPRVAVVVYCGDFGKKRGDCVWNPKMIQVLDDFLFPFFVLLSCFFSLYIGLIFRCPFSETFRAISILIPPSNFQKRWVIQSPNHPTRCRWCRRWVKKPLVRRLNFVGNLRLPEIQLMVNCWFGILGIPLSYSNNAFHKEILGIQTTNPSQQLSISLEMQSQERQFETWSSVELHMNSTWLYMPASCRVCHFYPFELYL